MECATSVDCNTYLGNSMVTELQIRDFGLLFNHFVLYSYDLSQFAYFYTHAIT